MDTQQFSLVAVGDRCVGSHDVWRARVAVLPATIGVDVHGLFDVGGDGAIGNSGGR